MDNDFQSNNLVSMKLPNSDRAHIDPGKIKQYCLSEIHSVGKHKAKVFKSSLGMTAEHSELLIDALFQAVRELDATPGLRDDYGSRYMIDFELKGPLGASIVRSIWIVLRHEDFPRFVTCFVV